MFGPAMIGMRVLVLAMFPLHTVALSNCSFALNLRGAECFGLELVESATSEAECTAACCAIESCTTWQFCGDFTTYCGAEHGGCYTGQASHCVRSQHCNGLDCWDGGCRGDKCPKLPPPPPPTPPPPAVCGSPGVAPCAIDLSAVGLQFDGIGGITSNGECRLLYDYPEPQRSEVLDYLFLPQFGLSSQILKVEIGSDAQSTVGTEPSYQHTQGNISYNRGIQYWFMSEAKKRNPNITIAALEWSAPSWVGDDSVGLGTCGNPSPEGCPFFTEKNIDYILGWMHGAINVWNISQIDYMGVWNEPPIPYIPSQWLVDLRTALDKNGYSKTQIVGPDAAATGEQVLHLLSDVIANTTVANSVDVIGTHGYWEAPPSDFIKLVEKYPKNAKRAWVSESWHEMGTWNGAKGMVSKVLSAQQQGYSGWTAWGLLFAAYPVTLCQDKGLLYATQPWAGSYNIQSTVWTTAHFTQFSKPGWSWLTNGNGTGAFGLSGSRYATLVDPTTTSWSTIVNNLDSDTAETVVFAVVANGVATKLQPQLSVFATNETHWFQQVPAPTISSDGVFTLQIAPATVYTVTTLQETEAPRKGLHAHSELAAPFPLPHSDNFSSYTDGRSPRFFTDWDGSFSVVSGVLKQQVLEPPIKWHCTDVDPITLVAPGYANYEVATTAKIDSANKNASLAYVGLCARVQKPFDGWCPSASGYCVHLAYSGSWSLLAGSKVIAQGTLPASANTSTWQSMKLNVDGTTITASANNVVLKQVEDSTFDNGLAALTSGYHYASFNTFTMHTLDTSPTTSPPPRSTVAGYPVFTGTSLSTAGKEYTGEFGLAFTPVINIKVTALARFAAAGSRGKHQLTIYCAAVNATQIDPNCRTNPDRSLGGVVVDMATNTNSADATGLMWGMLQDMAALVAGQQYFLVSEEGNQEASGDLFYVGTSNYPCIGAPGPGGTLPKLDVQINSVTVDGGAFRLRNDTSSFETWQPVLWDYRPRSFGPLSFSVA